MEQSVISIHAPHTRSDRHPSLGTAAHSLISIHAPHTRSDRTDGSIDHLFDISIHAPHTRSDGQMLTEEYTSVFISIHAPHTRSDTTASASSLTTPFQSTLLIRGATSDFARKLKTLFDFNPRSSYEERRERKGKRAYIPANFNPRSSYEERQRRKRNVHNRNNFNPRSSYEERLLKLKSLLRRQKFQSTLLIRGATKSLAKHLGYTCISIHAPHTRSDAWLIEMYTRPGISIHAPHTRSDRRPFLFRLAHWPFQSTLLIRGATIC